jgi:hypothetical protein
MTGMVRSYVTFAVALAPVRSGELKAGIHGDTTAIGPKLMQGAAYSDSPHTGYVIHGTHGPIMSNGLWRNGGVPRYTTSVNNRGRTVRHLVPGQRLAVGRNLYPPVRHMFTVSGQTANNFLERAWRATARNHRSIRGIRFPLA